MRARTVTRFARWRSRVACRASRRWPERLPPCMRSRMRGRSRPCPCRSGSMPRRERLNVVGVEPVGPYALLRLVRNGMDPGAPGQFFMLEAPGRVLPRALSHCLAPPSELHFLIDPVGPGTQALAGLDRGDAIHVFGPLGNGFDLDVERPLLVGGGIGMAPLPYLAEALRFPPTILGFRSELHAQAAALM